MLFLLVPLIEFLVSRNHSSIRLDSVLAPFTEFRYIHDDYQGLEKPLPSAEDKELRLRCAKEAALSLLRSWPGLLHLASTPRGTDITPIGALVSVLFQNSREKGQVRVSGRLIRV